MKIACEKYKIATLKIQSVTKHIASLSSQNISVKSKNLSAEQNISLFARILVKTHVMCRHVNSKVNF